RPWPAVGRSVSNKVAPLFGRAVASLRHGLKCSLNVPRRTVGQARDDGSTREYVGIGREHGRSHRPTRRKSNNEYAPAVDAMVPDHSLDHLPDREHLPVVALGVKRKKPVETIVGVVGTLLLREQHSESI